MDGEKIDTTLKQIYLNKSKYVKTNFLHLKSILIHLKVKSKLDLQFGESKY